MVSTERYHSMVTIGKWGMGFVGVILILGALFLDRIGLGEDPNFGNKQALLAMGGMYLLWLFIACSSKLRDWRLGMLGLIRPSEDSNELDSVQQFRQTFAILLGMVSTPFFWLNLAREQHLNRSWTLALLLAVTLLLPDFATECRRVQTWFEGLFGRTERNSILGFSFLALGIVVFLNWYPFTQMWNTGGYLCYQNAFDEYSYLQYDFSKGISFTTRPAQGLVTLGHTVGLSGGWLNFVFDVTTQLAFIFLARAILLTLNFTRVSASVGSLLALILPIAFCGGFNPIINSYLGYIEKSGWLYWVATSQYYWSLPLERSPEPQFTFVLASASILLALRYRSFWLAYPCIPFLYPFVAVPYVICLLSMHLCSKFQWFARYPLAALLLVFLCCSFGVRMYISLLTSAPQRDFFAVSHAPLISMTGLIALPCYLVLVWFIPKEMRLFGLFVALSPTLAANHQLVSGYFAAPHNYEACFGVFAISIVITLALCNLMRNRAVLCLATLALLVLTFYHGRSSFELQHGIASKIVLTEEVLLALKTNSQNIVINDPVTASLVCMVYPRQPRTVFGVSNTFPPLAYKSFSYYQWAKNQIRQRTELTEEFTTSFNILDSMYQHESADFLYAHNGRRNEFTLKHDLNEFPSGNNFGPIQIILLGTNGEPPRVLQQMEATGHSPQSAFPVQNR